MKQINDVTIKEATKRYNSMMNDFGFEHLTIGQILSEHTENWNLRDMVCECQYQLEVCYEEGNENNEGQYPDYWEYTEQDLLSKSRYDNVTRHNKEQRAIHSAWLSKTRRLRNFIEKYKEIAFTQECTEGHGSNFG